MKQAREHNKKSKSSLSWLLLLSLITIGSVVGVSSFVKKSIESLAGREIVLSHKLPSSDSTPPPFVF